MLLLTFSEIRLMLFTHLRKDEKLFSLFVYLHKKKRDYEGETSNESDSKLCFSAKTGF